MKHSNDCQCPEGFPKVLPGRPGVCYVRMGSREWLDSTELESKDGWRTAHTGNCPLIDTPAEEPKL